MGKKLIDAEMIGAQWYTDLSAELKLLYHFLWSKCDCSGMWEACIEIAAIYTRVPQDAAEALEVFGDRVQALSNGDWWIRDFVEVQAGRRLSPKSPAHKRVIEGLFIGGVLEQQMEVMRMTEKDRAEVRSFCAARDWVSI